MRTACLPTSDMGERPFLAFLAANRHAIDERIDERISLHAQGDEGVERHFRRGKRLRAGTTLLVHQALSGGDEGLDMVLDLGAAVELAHGISLMIDDLLDGERERRGEATLQSVRGPSRTVLEAVGLLAIPYSLAAPHGPTVIGHLAAAHEMMVRGAIIELDPIAPNENMDAYEHLISMKSGGLFELAALYGALAAGQGDIIASLASDYGGGLGVVHQFSDDIVDLRSALRSRGAISGSEGRLFHCMVQDPRERERMVERGTISEEVEQELVHELSLRIGQAERAAGALATTVVRTDHRRNMTEMLPLLLSAPREIAESMMGDQVPSFSYEVRRTGHKN